MPATRSRASTEQPAEVASEEVKEHQTEHETLEEKPIQQQKEETNESEKPTSEASEEPSNGSLDDAEAATKNGDSVDAAPVKDAVENGDGGVKPEESSDNLNKRKSESDKPEVVGDDAPDSTDTATTKKAKLDTTEEKEEESVAAKGADGETAPVEASA